jgi:hypothetical protein
VFVWPKTATIVKFCKRFWATPKSTVFHRFWNRTWMLYYVSGRVTENLTQKIPGTRRTVLALCFRIGTESVTGYTRFNHMSVISVIR